MMRRPIRFLVTLALGLLVVPLTAEGQQTAKIARIGFLSPGSPALEMRRLEAFWQALRELGYVEGHHLALESRYAEGQYDRLPGLAAELVRLKVDIILTYAPPAIQAAKQATGTVPIVMMGHMPTPPAPDPFTTMTTAEHVAEAKKALDEWKPHKDPMMTKRVMRGDPLQCDVDCTRSGLRGRWSPAGGGG
jgi:hypothetical protein